MPSRPVKPSSSGTVAVRLVSSRIQRCFIDKFEAAAGPVNSKSRAPARISNGASPSRSATRISTEQRSMAARSHVRSMPGAPILAWSLVNGDPRDNHFSARQCASRDLCWLPGWRSRFRQPRLRVRPGRAPTPTWWCRSGRRGRCAERVERSWWREPLRAVLATGDQELIDDFVELFKRAEARQFKKG